LSRKSHAPPVFLMQSSRAEWQAGRRTGRLHVILLCRAGACSYHLPSLVAERVGQIFGRDQRVGVFGAVTVPVMYEHSHSMRAHQRR
jgi:hypothetical protein